MSETPFAATDVPATGAHEIRITSSGKIQSWVDFALKFFEENEDRPLVFHTMPAEPRPEPAEQSDPPKPPAERNANKLHPSLALAPRLVSVAEIVKREYVKLLDPSLAEQGCLSGLHQYNEIVHLDVAASNAGPTDAEEQRLEALTHALQGRKNLKIKKAAYMKITLSRKQLPNLMSDTATYQEPTLRRLSKSARSRAKKRTRKEAADA